MQSEIRCSSNQNPTFEKQSSHKIEFTWGITKGKEALKWLFCSARIATYNGAKDAWAFFHSITLSLPPFISFLKQEVNIILGWCSSIKKVALAFWFIFMHTMNFCKIGRYFKGVGGSTSWNLMRSLFYAYFYCKEYDAKSIASNFNTGTFCSAIIIKLSRLVGNSRAVSWT